MAITDRTKKIVSMERSRIKQMIDANQADIDSHQDAILKIKARNITLKADYDALKKDIAEPIV